MLPVVGCKDAGACAAGAGVGVEEFCDFALFFAEDEFYALGCEVCPDAVHGVGGVCVAR